MLHLYFAFGDAASGFPLLRSCTALAAWWPIGCQVGLPPANAPALASCERDWPRRFPQRRVASMTPEFRIDKS